MSNYGRVLTKLLAESGNGSKIIRGNVCGNVNPLTEWIKWLSYEPIHERKRKEKLYSKTREELTIREFNELAKYKKRDRMAVLFKKYDKGQCTKREYMQVYDYMGKSITDLMLDKLSSEELRIAKKELIRLSKVSKEELSAKVKEEQKPENYEKLSMVDSYILHIISDINYARSIDELDRQIKTQIVRNEVMRQKSMNYDTYEKNKLLF